MSTLILNLDFGDCSPPKKATEGNHRHQRFIQRQRRIQRNLKQKQMQVPARPSGSGHSKLQNKGGALSTNSKQKLHLPPEPIEETPTQKNGIEKPLNRKVSTVSWLTPAPSRKTSSVSVASKVDLLSEFQSGLCPLPPTRTLPPASEKGCNKKMVALDCEMVGTGPKGHTSSLARCSIVSYNGDVLYDEYIRPPCKIVDYRTKWSGIKKEHMINATPFKVARKEILKILVGKIVVGHAIHNDFKALHYFHPKPLTRDTSRIPILNSRAGFPENESISLKRLTKQLLHQDIQVGKSGHSSVEDAKATMDLYKLVEVEWEQQLARSPPSQE
ncbi:interferon-stimulated 20 kDa exonuclease-like 2 [Antechinus flavipes]|uniref:interferon-stimulated 20 kDa exonuclease-like 2 n=1 Tax=Antechinus flavipes TaxID=38775 RepID=UPI0022355FCD|nr:interferon-stimulated 20 kDa exonuclease-like 2 [Antechinus flavipes]XP_051849728.1 interferon-stimulated 20 kDa exonuclease-like 2 [Antechinus flavipes]